MNVLEQPYARGHQSLNRNQLEYSYLAADRQRLPTTYLVREQHNHFFCPFHGSRGEIQLFRGCFTRASFAPLVGGSGCTRRGVRSGTMTTFSKPGCLCLGMARLKSWLWARVQTPDGLWRPQVALLGSFRRTCRATTRNVGCR